MSRLACMLAAVAVSAALAGCCGTYGQAYDPCQPPVCTIQPLPPCQPILDPCIYADPCTAPAYVPPPPPAYCPPPPCPPGWGAPSTDPLIVPSPAPLTTYPAVPPAQGQPRGTGPTPPEPRPEDGR